MTETQNFQEEIWEGPARERWEAILAELVVRGPARVLIATAGFGEGHNRAARALERMLATLRPDVDVRVIDVLDGGPRHVQRQRATYYAALRSCPALYAKVYGVLSRVPGVLPSLSLPYRRSLRSFITELRPDAVFATHVFCARAVQSLRAVPPTAVIGVITDWADDAYWNRTRLDRYLVASDELRQRLTAAGIEAKRILRSGIPVAPRFYRREPKVAAREALGLVSDRYTVLLLGGGMGLGPVRETARALTQSNLRIQVVVGTGRNEELRSKIEILKLSARTPLVAVPFTDRMDEYMMAADIAVTKPGGVTVAECLAQDLPLVLLGKPLPGPETLNEAYLLKNGLAVKLSDPSRLVRWVQLQAWRAESASDDALVPGA